MRVHVKVPLPLVFVLVRVDAQRFAKRPGADSKQHHTHQPLAPGGKQIHRQQIAKPKREQPDYGNARRVSDSPPHARHPASRGPARRQWRDGRKMICPGADVNDAGN